MENVSASGSAASLLSNSDYIAYVSMFFTYYFFMVLLGILVKLFITPKEKKDKKDKKEKIDRWFFAGLTASFLLIVTSLVSFGLIHVTYSSGSALNTQLRLILGLSICVLSVLPVATTGVDIDIEKSDAYRFGVPAVSCLISYYFVR